jgi:hypothetical protein
MAFQDDVAGVLAQLPIDALGRILKASEKSDAAGERALAEELSDELNRLTDALPEAAILERIPEPLREQVKAHLESKLPGRVNMSDVVRTRLTLRLLRAWLADQKAKANEEFVLEAARKRIAERRERIKQGLPPNLALAHKAATAPTPSGVPGVDTPFGYRSEAYRMPKGAVPDIPADDRPAPSPEVGTEGDDAEYWAGVNAQRRAAAEAQRPKPHGRWSRPSRY